MRQWQAVTGILLVMIACMLILYSAFRMIFGDRFSAGEYYALSLAGWLVPALPLSVLWYAAARLASPQTAA